MGNLINQAITKPIVYRPENNLIGILLVSSVYSDLYHNFWALLVVHQVKYRYISDTDIMLESGLIQT